MKIYKYDLQDRKYNNLKGVFAEEIALTTIRRIFSIDLIYVARAQPPPDSPQHREEISYKINLFKKIYDSIPLQHFDFLYKNWYTIDIFAILLDWKRADFTKIREKLLKREGTLFENGMSMGKQDINTSIEKIKEFLTNTKSIPLAMISSIKEKLPKKLAIFEVKGTKNKLSRLDFTEKTIEVYRKAKGIGIETYLMKVVFLDDWKCEVYLDAFKI